MSGVLSAAFVSILVLAASGPPAARSLAPPPVNGPGLAPPVVSEAFATNWSRAKKISDVPMSELASAVDSKGHVHVVGAGLPHLHSPLYYLTNASGQWVESEIAYAPRKGGFSRLGIAIDVDDSVWIVYTRWSVWNPCGWICPPPAQRSKREGTYLVNDASGRWSEPRSLPNAFTRVRWAFAVRDHRVHFAYDKFLGDSDLSVWYASDVGGKWRAREIGAGWGPFIALGPMGDPWIAYTAHRDAGGVVVAHAKSATSRFVISRAPGTAAVGGTAVVDGFDLDSGGRPVAIFSHPDIGYWSYWVRLGKRGWTAPRRLANEWATAFAVDSDNRMHFLYAEWDDSGVPLGAEGLYYGTSKGRIAQTVRIDRSTRITYDAPAAADSLVVDSRGRPHVVFAVIYDDNRLGVWYRVGPAQD